MPNSEEIILKFDDQKWIVIGEFINTSPQMKVSLEKYLNALDALFNKAKQRNECEFIQSLLRVSSTHAPGWDVLDGMEAIFDSLKKIRGKNELNSLGDQAIYLFMYGLILESDPLYELLANLLNVAENLTRRIPNFPAMEFKNKKGKTGFRPVPPRDKINIIRKRAKKLNIDLSLFDDFYDKDLRNAIFHSSYVLYNNEIRLPDFSTPKTYKAEEWDSLTNNAMAYYTAIMSLQKYHISLYDKPKKIKSHPQFTGGKEQDVQLIVREGHGVIAIKGLLTEKEIQQGKEPFLLGKMYEDEKRLIKEGNLLMPKRN